MIRPSTPTSQAFAKWMVEQTSSQAAPAPAPAQGEGAGGGALLTKAPHPPFPELIFKTKGNSGPFYLASSAVPQ